MTKLQQLFVKVLRLPADFPIEDLSPETASAWDSLRHIELMTAIEEAYGIRLSTREVLAMRSFAAAKELLQRRGLS